MESLKDNRDRSNIFILPPEILENIFAASILSAGDLLNLGETCTLFRSLHESNSLWRTKFRERWGELQSEVEKRKCVSDKSTELSWKSITRQRILVKQTVTRRLENMAQDTRAKFIKYQKAKDERHFYNFCELLPSDVDSELQIVFIIHELHRTLERSHKWLDLTIKYYAEKALWFFHHQFLFPTLEQFMLTSEEMQDIELGATLIAQWFQPRAAFTVEDIKSGFDALADFAKEKLKTINPEHPVLCHTAAVREDQSMWSTERCREIIQAIEKVLKITANKSFKNYYSPENSYINIVLHTMNGIPITLCLTVMCIARRLGLVLEPVNFPNHFILRWLEFPYKCGIEKYSFIDVFGGRYFLKFADLVDNFSSVQTGRILEAHCNRCTHLEVLRRMVRNLLNLGGHQRAGDGLDLLHHGVELAYLFIPEDVELAVLSAQVSLHLKINIPRTLSRIQEAAAKFCAQTELLFDLQGQCERLLLDIEQEKDKDTTIKQIKRRNKKVKFSVGMIMKHKRYNYQCVIRGWDETCQASEQWIKQMNVDRCERGRHQPFYKVWVNDGSDRYAAEENLVNLTEEITAIKHPEIGRLFESFTGCYYIAGPQLLAQYPDDMEVTADFISEFLKENHITVEMIQAFPDEYE